MWRRVLVVVVLWLSISGGVVLLELAYLQGEETKAHQNSVTHVDNISKSTIFQSDFFGSIIDWFNRAIDWTEARHDFIIAVATVFLAIFTLALFAATWGLLRFARIQSRDAQRSIRILRLAALAGARQARATVRLAQTAREDTISSHPPKIIVRQIMIEVPNIDGRPVSQSFRQGDQLRGRFTVANVGRSTGKITQSYSMFFTTDKALPMKPPYDGYASTIHNPPIELEAGWSASLDIVRGITITDQEGGIEVNRNWKLYVMGWIDCLDSMSRPVSRAYFCRVWSPSNYRFITADNPDYESEE
jgi:hypothetical protein